MNETGVETEDLTESFTDASELCDNFRGFPMEASKYSKQKPVRVQVQLQVMSRHVNSWECEKNEQR